MCVQCFIPQCLANEDATKFRPCSKSLFVGENQMTDHALDNIEWYAFYVVDQRLLKSSSASLTVLDVYSWKQSRQHESGHVAYISVHNVQRENHHEY